MNRQSDPIELFRPDPNGECLCGKKKPFKNCCGRVSDKRAPPEGMILKRGFLRADTCDKLITYADKQSEDSLKVRKKLSNSEETFEEVDTVTLYVGPENQTQYFEKIVSIQPKRVIFNPGTENILFQSVLAKANIYFEEACTLVLLSLNKY